MVVPLKHLKMIICSRKTHGFVGETHHFRKPPYNLGPRVPWKIKVFFLQDVRRLKSAGRSWCWLLQLVYTFGLVVDRAWLAKTWNNVLFLHKHDVANQWRCTSMFQRWGHFNSATEHRVHVGPSAYIDLMVYMGVSKNRGTPKWMIYNGNPY